MTGKADIIFTYSMSNEALLTVLGRQIKQMRLNKNLTQKELGILSGISRATISEMENKGVGTLSSFVQLLRALEKLEILNHFITDTPISPLQIAKLKGKIRQRASGNKLTNPTKGESLW